MTGQNLERAPFENDFINGDYDSLSNQFQENLDRFRLLFKQHKIWSISKEIEITKSQLSYLVKKEHVNNSVLFILGRYVGIIEALSEFIRKEIKKESMAQSMNSYSISEIPHINDIIISIGKEEGIRHGKLAEKVGIEKSTLTGIMDKLVKKGIVKFTRPGKYKYYYLTEIGIKYFNENHKILEVGKDIEFLTEQLMLSLSKSGENVNEKLLEIISKLIDGKSDFEGYTSIISDNVDLYEIFAGIPKIKPIMIGFPDRTINEVNNAFVLKTSLPAVPSLVSLQCNSKNDFEYKSETSTIYELVVGGVHDE